MKIQDIIVMLLSLTLFVNCTKEHNEIEEEINSLICKQQRIVFKVEASCYGCGFGNSLEMLKKIAHDDDYWNFSDVIYPISH